MAGYLNNATAGAITFVLWLSLSLFAPMTSAQTLVDPTRPSGILAYAQETGTSTGPVLQSVLISPDRMIAVISGQTIRLGETYGNARLEKISAGEIVLRKGDQLQILKLFPGLEKRPTTNRAGTTPNNPGQQSLDNKGS